MRLINPITSDLEKHLALEASKNNNWNLTQEELEDSILLGYILSNHWISLDYEETLKQLHKVIKYGEDNGINLFVKYIKRGRFYILDNNLTSKNLP